MFDNIRKHFSYGLVRLSSELKVIDKNRKAEEYRVFPKRGASVSKFTRNIGKLAALSLIEGDNIAVSFSDGIKSVEALAIRENSGEILVLLHPLLCSLTLGKGGKVPVAYGVNILKIIYGESLEGTFSRKDLFPFSSFSVKETTLVTTAVSNIAERINKINFKNSITVNFERMENSLSRCVDFRLVVYALTEILSLENIFSDGKSGRINISCEGETLDITLAARLKGKPISDSGIFQRLFSETLSLCGVNASLDFSKDGCLYAKASINTDITNAYVREDGVYIENAVFGYFDYAMNYYGFGVMDD